MKQILGLLVLLQLPFPGSAAEPFPFEDFGQ
jgi:hypothetical protein